MSYELFRTDVITNLSAIIPGEQMHDVMNAIDRVAINYDINKKSVSLIAVNGVPEPLKMYIASKATENVKKNTLTNYFYALRKFFAYVAKPVDQITASDIRCYLFDYQQKNKVLDRTLNQLRTYINGFYDWCVREDILMKNPCSKVLRIKYYSTPREPLDSVELETIRMACKTKREKAVVDLLYTSGVRVSELSNIKFDDIDWKTREVKIRHGKGDKYRITYFNAEAEVSLRSYLNTRSDDCPYVIVNERGKEKHNIGKRSIEEIIKKVGKRTSVDMKKAKPHNFRHTFATTMIDNGAPVQVVQQLLGHSKLETTMIYVKKNTEEIRRAHERCVI